MSENIVKFKRYAFTSAIFSFALAVACFFMASWMPVYLADLLLYSSVNTFLFSLLMWNEYRLTYNAEVESEEQQQIKKSAGASNELFDESDESLMLGARALTSWRRYILPAFTVVYGIGVIVLLVMKWFEWKVEVPLELLEKPMAAAACAGVLAVCYFLVAAFFSGASRQKGGVRLRPFSAWAYFNAVICVALLAVLFFSSEERPRMDFYFNRVLLIVFIGLAFELSVNFFVDLYRPRFQQDEKSILESRLLALFTDSGSIAANMAHALDYQFGIKITEKGFYSFAKRKFLPLLLIQLLSLYLLSCFAVIETGHRGLRETFGSIDEKQELAPGLYVKLPWPMSKIHIFPADKLQSVEVGQQPKRSAPEAPEDPGDESVTVTDDVVLWSKSGHNEKGMEEINYIIPGKSSDASNTQKQTLASVSMITVVVPIHYKIKKEFGSDGVSPLYKYLFKHQNAAATLKAMASHVVMDYLSRANYFDFMGEDRQKAAETLQNKLQTQADELELGVEIVFLALESTHPPGGDVSKAYDDVIAAGYDEKTSVFNSAVARNKILSQSRINAANIKNAALAETDSINYVIDQERSKLLKSLKVDPDSFEKIKEDDKEFSLVPMKLAVAIEKALRYEKQLESYQAAPSLYSMINYLDTLKTSLAETRKIIVDSNKTKINMKFDLKPTLKDSLSDINVTQD